MALLLFMGSEFVLFHCNFYFLRFILFLFMHIHVCLCVCMHVYMCMCKCPQRQEKGVGSPGAEVTGVCELPYMGIGN